MKKQILAAASCYRRKYYINPAFHGLPKEIQTEIRILCVQTAEKIHGVFTMGFYEDGSVFLEAAGEEVDLSYDEIGAPLEINRLKTEQKELIRGLQLWYRLQGVAGQ